MVSVAYDVLFQIDIYVDDCKLWRDKSEADKTWSNFKLFFMIVSQDLRQSKTTTQLVGQHALPHDTVDMTHTLETITTTMEYDQSIISYMTNQTQYSTA